MVDSAGETDWKSVAIQQQQRLQELEQATTNNAAESALNAALSTIAVHDSARPQLLRLLREEVTVTKNSSGQQVATGPNFRPLDVHIRETMAREEYKHFLRPPGHSGAIAPQTAAAPQFSRGQAAAAHQRGELPLGAAILEEHRAEIAEREARGQNDPRTNVRLPMGIYPQK